MRCNPETTIAGCIVIVGTLAYAYFNKSWDNPLILSGLATGIGLIRARDAKPAPADSKDSCPK